MWQIVAGWTCTSTCRPLYKLKNNKNTGTLYPKDCLYYQLHNYNNKKSHTLTFLNEIEII